MPSKQHTELIRRAICWLSNIATQKGIRSCPEIILAEGYVADAGAILNLQLSWALKFLSNEQRLRREIKCDDFTFVIEAKASKSDFNNTFIYGNHIGDRLTPLANFHFVVVSKSILDTHLSDEIAAAQVPLFWGILEESRNGLRVVKFPTYCPQPIEKIYEFGYRILRYSDRRKFMIIDLKEVVINETEPELFN